METEDPSEDLRVKDLARDLGRLAERLVPRALGWREPGKRPLAPLSLPQLAPIARDSFPREWHENRKVLAVELTIRQAINQLEGQFGSPPPKGEPDTRITNKEAALHYFNFDGSPSFPTVKSIDFNDIKYEHIGGPQYNKVLYALVDAAGINNYESTVTSAVKTLRLQLAKILAKLNDSFSGSETSELEEMRRTHREPYVHRSSLETKFRQLRQNIICFVGPPAVGKTRLAEELTRSEKPPAAITIHVDAGSNEQLERSLWNVLTSSTKEAPCSLPALEVAFRNYLVAKPPSYVVIDDVADSRLLDQLIPPGLTSTVVVTSRQILRGINPEHCIEIGNLEPSESSELILSLLPEKTIEEADQLARALAHHPMAITAACGMIADGSLSVAGFCSGLSEVAATVFDGVDDDGQLMLTAIYRQVLAKLNQTDPEAQLLLEMIALLSDNTIDFNILYLSIWEITEYRLMNVEQSQAVTRRALSTLVRHFLVSVSSDGVRLHQLARDILRGLLSDRQKEKLGTALLNGITRFAEILKESNLINEDRLISVVLLLVEQHVETVQLAIKGAATEFEVENYYEAVARVLAAIGIDTYAMIASVSDILYRRPPETLLMEVDYYVLKAFGFSKDDSETVGPFGIFTIRTGQRRYIFKGQEHVLRVMSIMRDSDGTT